MAMYEATEPLTLIAGQTVSSDLRGRLAHIISDGRVTLPVGNDPKVPVVGVFAQDSMIAGEPVTVNQLSGKQQLVAAGNISRGRIVVLTVTGGAPGRVLAVPDFSSNTQHIGIAMELASAGDHFEVMMIPYGTI